MRLIIEYDDGSDVEEIVNVSKSTFAFIADTVNDLDLPDRAAQLQRAAVLPDAPEPLFTYQWHCIECGEWHPEGVFHCPKAAHSQTSGGG